jgi:hypothetical protein
MKRVPVRRCAIELLHAIVPDQSKKQPRIGTETRGRSDTGMDTEMDTARGTIQGKHMLVFGVKGQAAFGYPLRCQCRDTTASMWVENARIWLKT